MKKHPKILNSVLIIMLMLSTLVFTGVESFAFSAGPPAAAQTTVPTKQITPTESGATSIPEKNSRDLEKLSKPEEQTGFKYAFFKFFAAMMGVLVSALAIFAGLKFYKKFVLKNNSKLDNVDYEKTLESPKDFKEAINLFLDKTDK